MKIYAILCTRDANRVTKTTVDLVEYLKSCGIGLFINSDAKSIFRAYQTSFKRANPDDEDIVIFCHDDIVIRDDPEEFVTKLVNLCSLPETGFVGPAGTTHLSESAVWWDQDLWREGKHRGKVYHLNKVGEEYMTYYGEPDDVVALDGLFLAAKAKIIRDVGLEKPDHFEGEWDFYDIHYTTSAFLKGSTNKILDMNILHNSRGELVGRDSWHKNREAFIEKNDLPIKMEL